jgi:hypothetical protein
MCPLARHVIVVRTVGKETRAEGLWAREAWASVAVLPRVIRRMLRHAAGATRRPFEVRVECTRRRDALAAASCELRCELVGIPPQ